MSLNIEFTIHGDYGHHKEALVTLLKEQFEAQQDCDVLIICGEQLVYAHKLVLIAFFNHLKPQLMLGKDVLLPIRLPVTGVKYEMLKLVLDFVYCGSIKLKRSQLKGFEEAAKILGADHLVGAMAGGKSEPNSDQEVEPMESPASPPPLADEEVIDSKPKIGYFQTLSEATDGKNRTVVGNSGKRDTGETSGQPSGKRLRTDVEDAAKKIRNSTPESDVRKVEVRTNIRANRQQLPLDLPLPLFVNSPRIGRRKLTVDEGSVRKVASPSAPDSDPRQDSTAKLIDPKMATTPNKTSNAEAGNIPEVNEKEKETEEKEKEGDKTTSTSTVKCQSVAFIDLTEEEIASDVSTEGGNKDQDNQDVEEEDEIKSEDMDWGEDEPKDEPEESAKKSVPLPVTQKSRESRAKLPPPAVNKKTTGPKVGKETGSDLPGNSRFRSRGRPKKGDVQETAPKSQLKSQPKSQLPAKSQPKTMVSKLKASPTSFSSRTASSTPSAGSYQCPNCDKGKNWGKCPNGS